MTYEDYIAALYQIKAKKARKSDRAEVRQLWNPNRPWAADKYGGRLLDEKSMQCRQAILDALAKYGSLSGGKLSTLLSGYGERRRENAKTYLITSSKVVAEKKEGSRFLVFSLSKEGLQ